MNSTPSSVLFVESYPQALAGQQATMTALLGRARQSNIEPIVLMPREGAFADRLRGQGYNVEIIEQPSTIAAYGGAVYRYGALRKLSMAAQVLGYVKKLRGELRKRAIKAVFCNDMRGLLTIGFAAKTLGIPVIIWDKLDKPHGLYDMLQLPIASRNLMISKSVAKKYPAWQRRLWRGRIKVVHNGIDPSRFQAANESHSRASLGLENTDIVLAIIGTVTKRKGHDLLFKALKKAQEQSANLRLLVIGAPDDDSKDFEVRIREAAPKDVQWLGYRNDIEALLPVIDVLVSPSRHEGMGRVNVEAMAAEIPVIGSTGTGIAEVVIDGETGFLVDPKNSDALCQAILDLANDKALRTRMGTKARQRAVAEFDAIKQTDVVLKEIAKMAGS